MSELRSGGAAFSGLRAFELGDYPAAVALFSAAAQMVDPNDDPTVAYLLARAQLANGNVEEAISTLRDALDQVDDRSIAAQRLGVALSAALCDDGRIQEAHAVLDRASVAALPDEYASARLLWARARIEVYEHHLDDAIIHQTAAIEILASAGDTNQEGRGRVFLAEILNALDLHEQAAHETKLALELLHDAPAVDLADALTERARAIARTDPEQGTKLATRALELVTEPWEHGKTEWALGDCTLAAGDPHTALDHYLKAEELMRPDPRYTGALLARLAAATRAVRHNIAATTDPAEFATAIAQQLALHGYADGSRMLDLARAEQNLADALRVIRQELDLIVRSAHRSAAPTD
jgi:tetratricopeptide (TPR) repeat protein